MKTKKSVKEEPYIPLRVAYNKVSPEFVAMPSFESVQAACRLYTLQHKAGIGAEERKGLSHFRSSLQPKARISVRLSVLREYLQSLF